MLGKIEEQYIHQGDLVFLVNTEKPLKTGFYRKVRDYSSTEEVCYILEKPLHKNFNAEDETLVSSRKEKGIFIMRAKTVRNDKYYNNNYVLLAVIRGVDTILLMQNNYDLTKIDAESKNTCVDSLFINFVQEYEKRNVVQNKIFEIAKNLI